MRISRVVVGLVASLVMLSGVDAFAGSNGLQKRMVGDTLKLRLSGSDDHVVKDIDVKKVDVRVTGSGELTLKGKADSLEIDVSGSGEVDARKLKVKDAEVDVTGSGEVRVYASETFEIDLTGSADAYIYGTGRIEHRSIRGSAEIHDRR